MELSILELTNKEQIAIFVEKKVNDCLMGDVNPLALKTQIKLIEVAIKQIDEQTKDMQLSEAAKYSAKSFEAYNSKIEIAELGTKYDFNFCQDSVWDDLNNTMNLLKGEIKERESFLKCIKQKMTVVNEITGEVTEIHPALKSSTTGLKITLK